MKEDREEYPYYQGDYFKGLGKFIHLKQLQG